MSWLLIGKPGWFVVREGFFIPTTAVETTDFTDAHR